MRSSLVGILLVAGLWKGTVTADNGLRFFLPTEITASDGEVIHACPDPDGFVFAFVRPDGKPLEIRRISRDGTESFVANASTFDRIVHAWPVGDTIFVEGFRQFTDEFMGMGQHWIRQEVDQRMTAVPGDGTEAILSFQSYTDYFTTSSGFPPITTSRRSWSEDRRGSVFFGPDETATVLWRNVLSDASDDYGATTVATLAASDMTTLAVEWESAALGPVEGESDPLAVVYREGQLLEIDLTGETQDVLLHAFPDDGPRLLAACGRRNNVTWVVLFAEDGIYGIHIDEEAMSTRLVEHQYGIDSPEDRPAMVSRGAGFDITGDFNTAFALESRNAINLSRSFPVPVAVRCDNDGLWHTDILGESASENRWDWGLNPRSFSSRPHAVVLHLRDLQYWWFTGTRWISKSVTAVEGSLEGLRPSVDIGNAGRPIVTWSEGAVPFKWYASEAIDVPLQEEPEFQGFSIR